MEKNFNETYLLIGMYLDLSYYAKHYEKHRLQRIKIGKKLKVRWNNDIDRDAFERYFSDHNITKEDIDLCGSF